MMKMERIIREQGREQYYNYYTSLGYDHKTAASLALFTYGRYRYREFSINDLYDSLYNGEEYLPPEEIEERERLKLQIAQNNDTYNESSEYDHASSGYSEQMIEEIFRGYLMEECDNELISSDRSGAIKKDASSALEKFYSPVYRKSQEMLAPPLMSKMIENVGQNEGWGYATDEYETIEEKDARSTALEPTSTFRMTANTASAGIILNQLRNGRRINKSMVRIEEMLNYFRYNSTLPENEKFNIAYELLGADSEQKYLYVNVQGCEEIKEHQNIIILLDVSGSMKGNSDETQAIVATIVSKLGNGDKLSLVTYSDKDRVELDSVVVNAPEDRKRILEKLLSIKITGCTFGSKGIEQAYKTGKKNYISGGNNQVILITDGDLNFGITDKGGLEELIELKKKSNIFLSVIGTGLYNYKDDKLETLSKHGNGVYRVVNTLTDVKKSIDEEYSSLVNIIAKDVKAQVEFNPKIVESYRLLGFENRTLSHEDFTNDKVISEPLGSGGYGVALYELKMKTDTAPVESGLKYSSLTTTGSHELGTVKVRYKEPLEDVSHELEKVMESSEDSYTDNLLLAFIIYVCAEKLRGSDKIGAEEIELAKRLYQELGESIKEKNISDLNKLEEVLEKSENELGVGFHNELLNW